MTTETCEVCRREIFPDVERAGWWCDSTMDPHFCPHAIDLRHRPKLLFA